VDVIFRDRPATLPPDGSVTVGTAVEELVKARPVTIWDADEEFRVAASHKGVLAGAEILIEFRKDHSSWDRLEDEVDFQFGEIKAEFSQWKQNRISAGDRYK
jgi:hypothetical protein